MRSSSFIIFLFLALMMACTDGNTRVTYIGNEGFLIQKNNRKILSDALFGGFESSSYVVPTDSLCDLMRRAKPPFNRIDLITVSHRHLDHFDPQITVDHLKNDPGAHLIAPSQAVDDLAGLPEYETVASRVHRLELPPFSDTTFSVKGIDIRALRLAHSPFMETDPESGLEVNRHRDIENLGYLFSIGNLTLFHGGDSNPSDSSEFVTFALQNEDIDLAFLDRLFLFRGETAQSIIEHYIQADHFVFMHISPANASRIAPFFAEDSTVTVFEASMESRELNFLKTKIKDSDDKLS